jgi:hypothetical protein
MNRISAVQAAPDFCLLLTFATGEARKFDARPLLTQGQFTRLQDPELFRQVRVVSGVLEWPGGLDLCADMLFDNSVPVRSSATA